MALELAEPEIVTLEEFTVAGLAHRGPIDDDFETIWADFDERVDEFDGLRKTGEYYGVVYEYDAGGEEYTYVAGVPVEDTDGLSPELTVVELPEATYAVFETGGIDVMDLIEDVSDGRLGDVDHEPVDGPLFEHYGPDYDPMNRGAGYELYVPVESADEGTDEY